MAIVLRILSVFFLLLPSPSFAEKRIALVLGNSAYLHAAPLANPTNDAQAIKTKLESLGVKVHHGEDLSYVEMRSIVRRFIKDLDGAEIALFFYAGHGMQVGGENYVLPVDARLSSEDDLEFEAITIASVLSAMERKTRTNLVFLDACRDNPLAKSMSRTMGSRSTAVGPGLAQQNAGLGTLISFSTQPGNVALDGAGKNSPYTAALLKHLGTPGEGILQSLVKVRREVLAATGEQQVPWDSSSLTGHVILNSNPAAPGSEANDELPALITAPQASPSASRHYEEDIELWRIVKNSGSKFAYQRYLQKFPNGLFVEEAQDRIERQDSAVNETSALNGEIIARLDNRLSQQDEPDPIPRSSPETVEQALRLSNTDRQKIQQALLAIGFDVGTADGDFGPRTRKGLRQFQIASRLPETGYLDASIVKHLLDELEKAPVGYDGPWIVEFHRYNYAKRDPGNINVRTLLARANVDVRDGEMFVIKHQVFTQDRNSFQQFSGRISPAGKVRVKTRLGALFGKLREYSFTVNGAMPEIVPVGRSIRIKGPKLWYWNKTGEIVHVRLDLTRGG